MFYLSVSVFLCITYRKTSLSLLLFHVHIIFLGNPGEVLHVLFVQVFVVDALVSGFQLPHTRAATHADGKELAGTAFGIPGGVIHEVADLLVDLLLGDPDGLGGDLKALYHEHNVGRGGMGIRTVEFIILDPGPDQMLDDADRRLETFAQEAADVVRGAEQQGTLDDEQITEMMELHERYVTWQNQINLFDF